MRYKYFFLLIFFALFFPGLGHSQEKMTTIDSLTIEVWPDYDQASVLILLTGTLPDNTGLPATVTLPLPEKAKLNVIARIDGSDGNMKDDISHSSALGKVTFTTPDLRFRMEYYSPYEINNNKRTFNFTWLADVSVTNFRIRVQQPLSSSSFTTEPASINVSKDSEGLTYYAFPEQKVAAGQAFSIDVNYVVTSSTLTSTRPTSPYANIPPTVIPSTLNTKSNNNDSIIIIVVVCLVFVIFIFVWKGVSRKPISNSSSPKQIKREKKSKAKFCHNCGKPVGNNDNFCIECGTSL